MSPELAAILLKSLLYAVYVVHVSWILGRGVPELTPSGWKRTPPPLPSWKSVMFVNLLNKLGSIEPLKVPGRCREVNCAGILSIILEFNVLSDAVSER